MWITLLAMAVAVSLEPFRVGMTVLMLNRPRPILQLLAFLSGGYAMGLSVGVIVLFVVGSTVDTTQFTLPRTQVVIGVLALAVAGYLAVTAGRPRGVPAWLRRLADGHSLWLAGTAGLGIALPSIDYLAALAVIASSGGGRSIQIGALVAFNAVAFALVELPLLTYLVAPARTRAAMTSLHDRLRSLRRRDVAVLLAVFGCVLLAVGVLTWTG